MREKKEGMGQERHNVRRTDVYIRMLSWERGGGHVMQWEEWKAARERVGWCLNDSQKTKEQLLPLWFFGTMDFSLLYHCSLMQINLFISAYNSLIALIIISWESWSQMRQLMQPTSVGQSGLWGILFWVSHILHEIKLEESIPSKEQRGRNGLPGTKLIKSVSFTFYQNYLWHMAFRVGLILSINFSWRVRLFRSARVT